MCGRAYITYTEAELQARYWGKARRATPLGLRDNFNLAPTQLVPVIRLGGSGGPELALMRWGLVPGWAKDTSIGYRMINARSETMAEKPAFRNAFKQRRCIVPLSGFYEWRRTEERKRPFAIHPRRDPRHEKILSVAGLWEEWKGPDGPLLSFAIVTRPASGFLKAIHDRMPAVLDAHGERKWLDPAATPAELKAAIQSARGEGLEAYEVSDRVNSPRNNASELLAPVTDEVLKAA